jgi:hypothetical protein
MHLVLLIGLPILNACINREARMLFNSDDQEWQPWMRAERTGGPDNPPSAPPTIPPIIINPFSYHMPAPAIDPRITPDAPPVIPPPCSDIRLVAPAL